MKEGWEFKKLSDVCDILNGFAFKSSKYVSEGIRVIRITNVQKGRVEDKEPKFYPLSSKNEIERYLLREGDLLISLTGNVGRVGRLPQIMLPAALNQRVACLRQKKNDVNKQFLYHFLNSDYFESICIKHSAGAAQLNLSTVWLSSYQIPVPPLSEQQSIVDYLDSSFAKIDAMKANAEKALNEAKAFFQASLKEMLEPKEGWKEKKLIEIGCTQTGTTPPKNDKDNYGDYMPFIRPSEIDYDGSGRIDYNSILKLSKKGAKIGRIFEAGSVLMVCIGATIGKVGYSERTISCNQQINVFTPNSSINYKFAYYAMTNNGFQHNVIKEGTSSQATLPIISKGKWEKLSISYPPLFIQQNIVETLDSLKSKVDSLQSNFDKISMECDALKQSILRQVFE